MSLKMFFLHSSSCYFIKSRCIRPNEQMIPGEFDQDKVQTQLKYTGVLETTRIRQQVCLHFEPSDCGYWNKAKLPPLNADERRAPLQ